MKDSIHERMMSGEMVELDYFSVFCVEKAERDEDIFFMRHEGLKVESEEEGRDRERKCKEIGDRRREEMRRERREMEKKREREAA